jgi:hypothetical protein
MEHFHKSQAGAGVQFERWLLEHQENGYFLNLQSKSAAMLHRASCGHLEGNLTGDQFVVKEKVCSTDKALLKQWARASGRAVRECECV